RPRPVVAGSCAQHRGDGPDVGFPRRDDRLWRRVAGSGVPLFGSVPGAGHCSTRRARRVAALRVVLVGRDAARRDIDRRTAGRDLWPQSGLSADVAGTGSHFTEHALLRDRFGVIATIHARPRPGIVQSGSGGIARRPAAGGAELSSGMAAADRAGWGNDTDLCRRLRRLPAARNPRLVFGLIKGGGPKWGRPWR